MSQSQTDHIILEPLRLDAMFASIISGIVGISFMFFDQLFLGFILILVAVFVLATGKNYYLKIGEKTISMLSYIPKNKFLKEVGLKDVDWFSERYYIHEKNKIIIFRISIDNKKYTFHKSEDYQLRAVSKRLKELGYEFYKKEEDGSFSTEYYRINKK